MEKKQKKDGDFNRIDLLNVIYVFSFNPGIIIMSTCEVKRMSCRIGS